MVNEKITERRIGQTHQPCLWFAEERQTSIRGNNTFDENVRGIPNPSVSVYSASQTDQWENGYTGNFCGVYREITSQPDRQGKKVGKFERDDHQQISQVSAGGVFVKERPWPNQRGKLKYHSPMTVCGSKSSLRFIICSCQPIAKLFQLNNLGMN